MIADLHQKFFALPRWYNSDTNRCEQRVIVNGLIARCEGCWGHEEGHVFVAGRRVANLEDFEECPVKARDAVVM